MDAQTAKQLLEEEQTRLLALLEGLDEVPLERPQAENPSTVFEHEKDRSIRHQVESDLRDVADALARVEAGRYGSCETCGIDLPAERLEAVPATRFCTEHEGMWEVDRLNLSVPAGAYVDEDGHAAEREAARMAGRNLDLVPDEEAETADAVTPGPEQRALHLTDPARANPDALTADELAVLERRRAEWTDDDERVARDAAREEEEQR